MRKIVIMLNATKCTSQVREYCAKEKNRTTKNKKKLNCQHKKKSENQLGKCGTTQLRMKIGN